MSVGAGIHESYWTDPLTLATKKLTDKGITVVAAAGNLGQNSDGKLQYGGITAPGNAPWVLTVGASSTMGTLTRSDDEMARFSSAGPSFLDFEAKPDLVAPGVGTASLAVPGSTFYITKPDALLDGNPVMGSKAYLSLSGTSMAAPVVTGTVALMLQANSPDSNLIKALLQYWRSLIPVTTRCARARDSSTRWVRCGSRSSTPTRSPAIACRCRRCGAARSTGAATS
jgi:serine protease AprX